QEMDRIRPMPVKKILSFRRNPQPEQQQNQQTDQMQDIPNFLPQQLRVDEAENKDANNASKEGKNYRGTEDIPPQGRRLFAGESNTDSDRLPPPRRSPASHRNFRIQPSATGQYMNVLKAVLAVVTVCVVLSTIPLFRRQKNAKDSRPKVILLWNEEKVAHLECGCLVTDRRDHGNKHFDAVVFNGDRSMSLKDFNDINSSLVVYSAREPLELAQNPLETLFFGSFDLTMSYRRDSELVWSDYYFSHSHSARRVRGFQPKRTDALDAMSLSETRHFENMLRMKTIMAVYLMYEVNNDTLPESLYLEHMRQEAYLHARDNCLGNECVNYHFMLIFESSKCPDYVPPQMYMAMQQMIVPVLIGGGNMTNLVPEASYIQSQDFPTPKDLVNHMEYLMANPEEYMGYFWWRALYKVRAVVQPYCALCHYIQTPAKDRPINKEASGRGFIHWWTEYQCPNRTTSFL
ncbi:hypothetical protein KR009_009923, partial [Drosophila setifemur]